MNEYSYDQTTQQMPQQEPEKKGFSITSLVLGICSFIACCIPLFGYPVSITGIVFGILGIKKGGKGMAIAGIVMSILGLILTLVNSILGAYLGATGQLYQY